MEAGKQNKNINQKIVDEVLLALGDIKYGEVIITVHDAKIVQVEKREKKRFLNK
ncbi:MAG: YezD family protein [Candidatus Omnitrophica bacterium]|nr:YezD family protein [Candidatus Omnitrophota bacterium]MBU1925925.1 YezD family protein [Candidatus Omnitrophota bacterium]MBU2064094.1 YezD family protein [Candidatus Omnitrophota bacterium]